MNRRCSCAASIANSSVWGTVSRSSHGDISPSGSGRSGVRKTRSAQIICIHVVPCLERVLITMSPSRNGNAAHRALSSSGETNRRSAAVTTPRPNQRARRLEPKSSFSSTNSVDGSRKMPMGDSPEKKSTSMRATRPAPNSM